MSFDLKGIFNIDGRPAQRSVKQIEQDVQKSAENMTGYLESAFSGGLGQKVFSGAFKAAGLGAVATLAGELADKFQEKLKSIKIGSLRTGLDVETFQRLQNVTEAQGSSADTAARAMEHIAIAQQKIKEGGPEAEKLLTQFSALGVTLQDIESRSFQEIFFKIAAGMKDAELNGEKLAAIHEVLGRSGAELIPAFKKGFDSTQASAGLITQKDMENFDSMKKTLEESDGIWKDMAKTVGALAMAVGNSFRGIPVVFKEISNGDFFKKFTAGGRKQMEDERQENARLAALRAEQAETIRQKDAEESKRQLEERRVALDEEKAQKKAEEHSAGLESQLAEKERRNQLERMSPSARKAELRREIQGAKDALLEAQASEEPGDAIAHNETLKRAIRLQDLQHELFGLEKPKESADDKIHDALARVGGGFVSDNGRTVELLEQIKESTGKTAESIQEMKGQDNPMSGN